MYYISIIGCGVIGLTTATVIQNEYKDTAKITIFAENFSPNTTSDVSAGMVSLTTKTGTNSKQLELWSKCTRDFMLNLWKSGFASEAGITLQLVKLLFETRNNRVTSNAGFGLRNIRHNELKRYNNACNTSFKSGCTFVTFACELSRLLPFLQKQFVDNGGILIEKKIENLDELSQFDLVVNCAGLGSMHLLNDNDVVPIRGQTARVDAPWQFHAMMSNKWCIIPKLVRSALKVFNLNIFLLVVVTVYFLGSTSQKNDWNIEINESDTKMILDETYKLAPNLKNVPILYQKVGLRPGRSEVRLEVTTHPTSNKDLLVIHNYGHGSLGVTLSYGCALEVLQLVKNVLGF